MYSYTHFDPQFGEPDAYGEAEGAHGAMVRAIGARRTGLVLDIVEDIVWRDAPEQHDAYQIAELVLRDDGGVVGVLGKS